MKTNAILFLLLTALFAGVAVAVTLFTTDHYHRGYVNTPIGFAIISALLSIREEVVGLRRDNLRRGPRK